MRAMMSRMSVVLRPVGTARSSRRWVMIAALSGYIAVTAGMPSDRATRHASAQPRP